MARKVHRSFGESAFGPNRFSTMGEDVNPSAYIVNLADCMLVLAVGFLVALVAYWNIDISMTDLSGENLSQVDPDSLPQDLSSGGDYYVEAGTVYQDPQTGELYMVETQDGAVEQAVSGSGTSGSQDGADSGSQSGSGSSAGAGSSSASSASGSSAAQGSSADGSSAGSGASSGSGAASAGSASDEAIRNSRANGGD